MSTVGTEFRMLRLTHPPEPSGDEQLMRDFPEADPEVDLLKRRLHLADIVLSQEKQEQFE